MAVLKFGSINVTCNTGTIRHVIPSSRMGWIREFTRWKESGGGLNVSKRPLSMDIMSQLIQSKTNTFDRDCVPSLKVDLDDGTTLHLPPKIWYFVLLSLQNMGDAERRTTIKRIATDTKTTSGIFPGPGIDPIIKASLELLSGDIRLCSIACDLMKNTPFLPSIFDLSSDSTTQLPRAALNGASWMSFIIDRHSKDNGENIWVLEISDAPFIYATASHLENMEGSLKHTMWDDVFGCTTKILEASLDLLSDQSSMDHKILDWQVSLQKFYQMEESEYWTDHRSVYYNPCSVEIAVPTGVTVSGALREFTIPPPEVIPPAEKPAPISIAEIRGPVEVTTSEPQSPVVDVQSTNNTESNPNVRPTLLSRISKFLGFNY